MYNLQKLFLFHSLKQMELQDVEQHMGISTTVCENVCRLLKCMVTAARVGLGSHVCALKVSECAYCEASVMWHQLSAKLVQFMAPEAPVRPPDVRKSFGNVLKRIINVYFSLVVLIVVSPTPFTQLPCKKKFLHSPRLKRQ